MLTTFEQLGRHIEQKIENLDNLDENFPIIADDALAEFTPDRAIDARYMVDWILSSESSIKQSNWNFGDPPLNVFVSSNFYIQVLFWFPSRTGIHDHGFCGAFKVLQGASLQTKYTFHLQRELDPYFSIGDLEVCGLEFLKPGDRSKILHSDGFIHAVAHLGMPSITLVVRTNGLEANQKKDFIQIHYSMAGTAVKNQYQQALIQRELQTLFVLNRIGDKRFYSDLATYLENRSVFYRYKALMHINYQIKDQNKRKRCIDIVLKTLDSDVSEKLLAMLDEENRKVSIWSGAHYFEDKSKYLDLAMAELVGKKKEINDNFKKFYPHASASKLMHQWKNQVTREMT